jgi:hypothetical protein
VPHGDNPAARLQAFMKPLRTQANSGTQAGEFFAKSMGVHWPSDISLVLARLAEVAGLAWRTRRIAIELPPEASADLLLRHFDQVEAIVSRFGTVGGMEMTHLLAGMTDSGWHSLDLAADLLHRYVREPVIPDEAIEELIAEVGHLLDDVYEANDLDDEAKAWLRRRLIEIRQALRDVNLTGYGGVARAYDSAVGGIVRAPNLFARIADSKVMAGFVVVMNLLSTALTTAQGVSQLMAPPTSPEQVQVVIQQLTGPPTATPAPSASVTPRPSPRTS